jgi:glycosyltransferase involved in cell wall biosynthesis
VPANFGGSDTAVEEIGARLASLGLDVVVYCRAHNSTTPARDYRGMKRVVLPSLNTSSTDTLTHSLLATLHMRLTNSADVMHFHGMGNALLLPLFWLSGKRTVITIDGPDWERPKWGRLARLALRLSARVAARWADHLIIDNRLAVAYFRRHLGVEGSHIPYGADPVKPISSAYLDEVGLEPGKYVLFVGALVPDKGPDVLIDAYRRVATDLPLVVVGDSPFLPEYRERLRAAADSRVRFLGYVFGDHYRQLLANAYAYVHPPRNEGTSPALLQALAYGSCVVVNSLPEALAAIGDAGLPYRLNDPADLARQIERIIADPALADDLRRRARAHAEREYSWDSVAAQHEAVYASVLRARPPRRHPVVQRQRNEISPKPQPDVAGAPRS